MASSFGSFWRSSYSQRRTPHHPISHVYIYIYPDIDPLPCDPNPRKTDATFSSTVSPSSGEARFAWPRLMRGQNLMSCDFLQRRPKLGRLAREGFLLRVSVACLDPDSPTVPRPKNGTEHLRRISSRHSCAFCFDFTDGV